jgi:hypothetical protein
LPGWGIEARKEADAFVGTGMAGVVATVVGEGSAAVARPVPRRRSVSSAREVSLFMFVVLLGYF